MFTLTDLPEILDAIRREDPDGWTREPTEDDRRAFRSWVSSAFGMRVFNIYFTRSE